MRSRFAWSDIPLDPLLPVRYRIVGLEQNGTPHNLVTIISGLIKLRRRWVIRVEDVRLVTMATIDYNFVADPHDQQRSATSTIGLLSKALINV